MWEKMLDYFSNMLLLIPVFVLAYIITIKIPGNAFIYFARFYIGFFAVPIFQVSLNWYKEENIISISLWKNIFTVILFCTGILLYCVDAEKGEILTQHRNILDYTISMFFTFLLMVIYQSVKEYKMRKSTKLNSKKIRTDLCNRTPELDISITDTELIRYCERFFYKYIDRYKKIQQVDAIEHVNLMGVRQESWYGKAACYMKDVVCISIFGVFCSVKAESIFKICIIIVLIILFLFLINLFKHVDKTCLNKIAIRLFFYEWGYYLTWGEENKYVGSLEKFVFSKYQKYVYSFLNIAAFCRAIAYTDQISIKEENRISMISRNLSDLYINYTEQEEKNWVMYLPLWQVALFEYDVTRMISLETKVVLNRVVEATGEKRPYIFIFLQSFWADIKRKKIEDGISDFVLLFEKELFT